MKRKLKKILFFGMTLLLCAVMPLVGMLGIGASPTQEKTLDYGVPSMESNLSILPSALFRELFGETLTAAEADYLDNLSGISFVYNNALPGDALISTEYNSDTGVLLVTLEAHRFTASNGVTVEWVPTEARIDETVKTVAFENGVYSCRFDGLFHSDDFEIEVDFSWNAELPASFVDALLTSSQDAARETLALLQTYEEELALYEAASARYQAYVAYMESVEAYRVYSEIDLPAYEEALAEYEDYCDRYATYSKQLEAYTAWQQYWAYDKFMSGNVQAQYIAYQNYLKELAPVQERIAVLEALFVGDSHGWQLYASLMGNTVTQVVANKGAIVAAVPAAAPHIDAAGEATGALRALLAPYAELRAAEYSSTYEKTKALFEYYTQNYTALRDQFAKLHDALHFLGSEPAVILALQEGGQMEHYFQFVGQLYYTKACLDDSLTLDESWYIYHPDYKLLAVVEASQRLSDRTASPTGISMPAAEVPKIEKVEPIERPNFEEVRDEPTEPEPVEEPTAPEPVAEPDTENPPPEADDPGEVPVSPVSDTRLITLAEQLRAGTLPLRKALGEDRTLLFCERVSCPVSIRNLKTVTFYSADGKTVLDRQTLNYGESFRYRGPDTARASDTSYHYYFRAWVLADGTAPELVAYSNLSLYAFYYKTPRFYTVTWTVDGRSESGSWRYGETPTCSMVLYREQDHAYSYEFSGWDKAVEPVTGDVTYTGSFLPTLREYEVTWKLGDRTETELLPYGTLPEYTGDTSCAADSYRYTFLGWDRELTAVSGAITYTAEYRRTALATSPTGQLMEVVHGESSLTVFAAVDRVDIREAARLAREQEKDLTVAFPQFSLTVAYEELDALADGYCRVIGITDRVGDAYGMTFTVSYLNSAGLALSLPIPATLQTALNTSGKHMYGTLEIGGESVPIAEQGSLTEGGFSLRVVDVFSVGILSETPCNTSEFPRYIAAGEQVDLGKIGVEMGYEITSAKLIYSDGSTKVYETLTFTMPKDSVQIELTIEKIIYRVSFVVDGKVIHTAEYGMLQEIKIPEAPTKADDANYSYTFLSWSPELQELTYGEERDIVYEAVFSAKLINPVTVKPERSLFLKYLYIGLAILAVLIVIAVLIVLMVRKKKKAKRALEEKKAETRKWLFADRKAK